MEDIFSIFRITAEEADRINASGNEPHIHDYEELIVGVEGQLEHFIDYRSEMYTAPYVSFIAKGKLHRVRPLALNWNAMLETGGVLVSDEVKIQAEVQLARQN